MEVQHTILIVDDNRLIRDVYRALLELEGFSVVEASNGAEALMWCLKETADAILLDLEMPVLDGWSFLEYRLRQPKIREVPVLVVTSQPDTYALRQDLHRLRADRLLQKSVLRDDLLSAVREILARPPVPTAVPSPEKMPEGAKRRDPRVVFSIPIRVRMRSSRDTSGRLRDLSAGGLGAYLPRRLTEGETVTVSFDINGSLALTGLVQWAGESLTVGGYRHGIRFTARQEDSFPLNAYSFFREHSEALN